MNIASNAFLYSDLLKSVAINVISFLLRCQKDNVSHVLQVLIQLTLKRVMKHHAHERTMHQTPGTNNSRMNNTKSYGTDTHIHKKMY